MKKNSRIYVAGHRGLVGSALTRALRAQGFTNLILRTRKELDLMDDKKVKTFFAKEKPEFIFLAAAKVGGIMANKTQKADFIFENLAVQNNVIYNAWKFKTKKLLFLGSSCIYPRDAKQPIKESYFMTGPLEETNDAYAVAKIAGIKLIQSFNDQYKTNFISVMPTNLYGPNDNFDLSTSHVLPALIRRFHEAKKKRMASVTLWGSGKSLREFLHVDDMADACIFLMKTYKGNDFINIGYGKDISIKDLAEIIKSITGYTGKIIWDKTKPDGTPKKQLNINRLKKLGWKPTISLKKGIATVYEWYLQTYEKGARR